MSPDGEVPETQGWRGSSPDEHENRRLNSKKTGQGVAKRRDRVRTRKSQRWTRVKHTGVDGKGSKLFSENKGSCLPLAAGERARLGLGQLSRKEGRVMSTKVPTTQLATISVLVISSLHCEA